MTSLRIWRVGVIVAAGMALGFTWNAFAGRGLALSSNAFIKPGEDVVEIQAAEARKRLDEGALFLDARPVAFYEMSHIPGAVPLPEDDFDGAFTRLEPRLRNTLDLVVYCAGYGCEAAHIVARKLREKGVHAAILHEGWPAWTDAGYPTKEGKEP